ncbi:MAG: nitroreductase/quinone reductase family protein [Chloroflexia bacterium]
MTASPDTRPTEPDRPAEEAVKPPLPKWAYSIVNPVMGAILRSPLHRLLSGALMLLSFRGVKSGKQYRIPVGYIQEGEHLFIFSHAAWWRNLPGQPVTVRLRGQERRGTARRLEDRREIAALVQKVLARRGDAMARRMGLLEYADPDATGPLPQRTRFFDIALDPPAS